LIENELTRLRDKNTGAQGFRQSIDVLAGFLLIEATRDLALLETEVETPIAKCACLRLADPAPFVFQVLRAGQSMIPAAIRLLPDAVIGTIGLYRDEKTLKPVTYFHKPEKISGGCDIFILDPLLATGGTSSAAVQMIKRGADAPCRICMLSIIAAPQGLDQLERDHPDVKVYVCAIDEKLNGAGYIVPGAGDVGDRYCGTL
jgi:uracil phosphoribosyltransferase